MPATPSSQSADIRVLITGFGPFGSFTSENPSWTAVKTLHDLILHTNPSPSPTPTSTPPTKSIHITSLLVPTEYAQVLQIVPQLHARPPILPSTSTPDSPAPPPEGYDFILHVGVAPPDLCRLESQAHQYGYDKPDAVGKFAPIIDRPERKFSDYTIEQEIESPEERAERERLEEYYRWVKDDKVRGFGGGYEEFDNTIISEMNAPDLVDKLKEGGYKDVRLSNNAGRYLCDFIYYCSLAEHQRTDQREKGKSKSTKVLFLHCPPIDKPLSTDQVADCIKRLVVLVCGKLVDSV